MSTHATPSELQRRHWYAVDVGAGLHVPAPAVSVCPSRAVPETLGETEYVGPAGAEQLGKRNEAIRVFHWMPLLAE
jgi:hypothetical protein